MRPLNHTDARVLIQQAADGLLNAEQQRALENHLQGCADCRAFAAEFAALEGALGSTLSQRWGKPQLSVASEAKLVKTLHEQFPPSGNIDGGQGSLRTHGSPGAEYPRRGFPTLAVLLGVSLISLILLGLFQFGPIFGIFGPSPTPTFTETVTPSVTLTASSTPTATSTPTITQTPSPSFLILTAIPQQNVNCRLGNSSMFDIADTLFLNEVYTPIARGIDNLWVQFRGPVTNVKCWVFVNNIDLLINEVVTPIEEIPESLLPYVNYPPTPTPTFTASPEPQEPSDTPPPASQPQCNDGTDNDQDGAIDMRDKDCKDTIDNNEFD